MTNQVRVVIIGVASSVKTCARLLARSGADTHRVVGAVLTQPPVEGDELGVPVLGRLEDLEEIRSNQRIDLALISIPAVMSHAVVRAEAECRRLSVPVRFMPTVEDVLLRDAGASAIRAMMSPPPIDPMLLIGREPRQMDMADAERLVRGRRVLITGAGGSIGSELARICARCRPSRLILMDRSENPLFEIDRAIASRHPAIDRRAILHDVVEERGTQLHFEREQPDVVFHAAAHKHVPMMEDHPSAAVNNNVFGTKAVADAAINVGVSRFVMISSDKAVNPSSVMGATKRLAEIYVRSAHASCDGATDFRIVRFGNVLGSACSVLPIWLNQLADGGPITVTDPRMTRYFMTIPEAASLVIQAAAIDSPGHEVFELDMGDPVPILDIAVRLIRLCGLKPVLGPTKEAVPEAAREIVSRATDGVDVRVAFTGMRPGEKLHEELAYQLEELIPTACRGILAWAGPGPVAEDVQRMIADLTPMREEYDPTRVVRALTQHIPELGPKPAVQMARSGHAA